MNKSWSLARIIHLRKFVPSLYSAIFHYRLHVRIVEEEAEKSQRIKLEYVFALIRSLQKCTKKVPTLREQQKCVHLTTIDHCTIKMI